MSTISDAFIETEQRYRDEMLSATWGHLHPKDRQWHRFEAFHTIGTYRNHCVIETRCNLPDSPWLYQSIHNQLFDYEQEPGALLRTTARIRANKDGSFYWDRVKTVKVPLPFTINEHSNA